MVSFHCSADGLCGELGTLSSTSQALISLTGGLPELLQAL
jgi:hypothetical protein